MDTEGRCAVKQQIHGSHPGQRLALVNTDSNRYKVELNQNLNFEKNK